MGLLEKNISAAGFLKLKINTCNVYDNHMQLTIEGTEKVPFSY